MPSNEDLASTGYHAQFTFSHEIPAEETERVLGKYDIISKTTKRKGQVIFSGTISATLKHKLKLCGVISEDSLADTEILLQMNKLMGGV